MGMSGSEVGGGGKQKIPGLMGMRCQSVSKVGGGGKQSGSKAGGDQSGEQSGSRVGSRPRRFQSGRKVWAAALQQAA
jgi:hypothetical protein